MSEPQQRNELLPQLSLTVFMTVLLDLASVLFVLIKPSCTPCGHCEQPLIKQMR